ncbi:MAG: hypothetical protein IPP27_06110 [Bacteroidetes bacterium]|nr:hypothetical protein [Bacteroidota bacterium]MBK8365628.1 hypothetical protein [Bacteroidota bacterium]MBL0031767.1 hypothetical protein [Bacteroidota bacterium]MBP6426285.1 hypothetical protein [Bacteroidia bacterium]MBP6656719.1 hypothetical protein [Bacteroidia bacterium]
MFQKARDTAYLESTSLLILLIRWKKPLIITVMIAAIASAVFSGPWFVTPKFKSSVVFFPSSTNSISKALLEESSSEKQDILAYGEEEQAEQMLQILNSDEIRETIIKKYNLIQHYKIQADDPYPQSRLYEEFKSNITFSRTEFLSVRIEVLDTDPQMAADIANDISSLLDSMKTKIQHERAQEALNIIETSYNSKLSDLKQKEDSLQQLRTMGIIDYGSQAEILSEAYTSAASVFENESAMLTVLDKYHEQNDSIIVNTKARIKGAEAKMKGLQTQINKITQFGGASISLNSQIGYDRAEISKLKDKYEKLKLDANQSLTHQFIVNKAVKSERKSYPVRWLIILATSAGAFFIALLTIMSIQRYQEIKN